MTSVLNGLPDSPDLDKVAELSDELLDLSHDDSVDDDLDLPLPQIFVVVGVSLVAIGIVPPTPEMSHFSLSRFHFCSDFTLLRFCCQFVTRQL